MLRITHHSPLPCMVMVAFLWAVTALGCADRATPPQASAPSATIVSVEGASTTYHTRDWNGKTVTVRVPSQSTADIRGKDAEGTVRGTITSVDPTSHRVRVRTSGGGYSSTHLHARSPACGRSCRSRRPRAGRRTSSRPPRRWRPAGRRSTPTTRPASTCCWGCPTHTSSSTATT